MTYALRINIIKLMGDNYITGHGNVKVDGKTYTGAMILSDGSVIIGEKYYLEDDPTRTPHWNLERVPLKDCEVCG
jgi:hypothetical protein